MKLVIDMPKEKYEWIKAHNLNIDNDSIVGAVANGTPYEERPKGKWLDWVYDEQKHVFVGWICSSCRRAKSVSYTKHEYCPCCGARME